MDVPAKVFDGDVVDLVAKKVCSFRFFLFAANVLAKNKGLILRFLKQISGMQICSMSKNIVIYSDRFNKQINLLSIFITLSNLSKVFLDNN